MAAAGIAVLGLVAGGVQAASGAESPSASAAIASSWSSVPEFSSAPALAQGQLVDSAGAPVSGATVILFPVPVKPKTGDKLKPLARTTTGAASIPFAKLRVHPEARTAQTSAIVRPAGCGITDYPAITPVPVVVGMRETAASDATTSFTYSTSSSMTLGTGVSYTSANAGFTANGTTTQTSGGSYTFRNMTGTGNNHLQGDGVYAEWENYCVNVGGNNVYQWNLQQEDVASEYTYATPGTPAIPAGKCITSTADSPNTFSTGTQQTFSAGAQLSVAGYGINLSSQDGFTKDSSLTYTFSAHGHPICGSGGYPGSPGYTGVIGVHSGNLN